MVGRLIELSRHLPVIEVPLDSIGEVDSNYWFGDAFGAPTVREVGPHMRLVQEMDPRFPIILGSRRPSDGWDAQGRRSPSGMKIDDAGGTVRHATGAGLPRFPGGTPPGDEGHRRRVMKRSISVPASSFAPLPPDTCRWLRSTP